MDEENTTSRPDSSRRRLKIAGIATAALLAVPGGAVISNAFAADGGSTSSTPAQPSQSQPAQVQDPAPQQRGEGDGQGPRGDHRDCPGKGGEGQGGSGDSSGSGGGESGTTGTADTAYTLQ